MNPLLKKEIRLLLPAWIAAMLLAIVPVFFTQSENLGLNVNGSACITIFFMAGTTLLAISPFGLESGYHTFSGMLAQPVQRRRFWITKITVLALALATVLAAFWATWVSRIPAEQVQTGLLALMPLSGWWVVATFAGGLWTTLLFRQVIAAFWLTFITPFILVFLTEFLLDKLVPNISQYDNTILVLLDLFYLLAGFFLAKRLFYRAQDTQWTDREISFRWRKKKSAAASASPRPGHWFSALVWKELQLHQINLAIAAVILVLHVASVIARKIHPQFQNPDVQFCIETVWLLWMLMPFLIGTAAVSEEHKLRVAESQLCLPVSRRAQFIIKFSVAFMLSMLVGALLPSLIERTISFGENSWLDYWIFYAAAVLFFISFYASTLARSSLLAMAAALSLVFLAGPILAWVFDWLLFRSAQGRLPQLEIEGRLLCFLFIAVAVLPLVLVGLMFWNFKWLHQTARLWQRNATVLLLSFVFIYLACNAIFFRIWECFLPLEPIHSPARLSLEQPAKLFPIWDRLIVATPDGRTWQENIGSRIITAGKLSSKEAYLEFPYPGSQQFLGGSDWKVIAPGLYYILGIHTNGTLWCLPEATTVRPDGNNYSTPQKLVQLGSDTDWKDVVTSGRSFFLLKNNGSLWVWNTNHFDVAEGEALPHLDSLPSQYGSDADWVKLLHPAAYWGVAEKNDGSLWTWGSGGSGTNHFSRVLPLENWADQWTAYAFNYNLSAGVSTNGELWLFYQPPTNWLGGFAPDYVHKVKLDSGSRWKAVMFSPSASLILLRQDGTLWKWTYAKTDDYINWDTFQLEPFNPVQLGHQSTWIALSGDYWTDLALAADGTLWSWDQVPDHLWLAPSRQPLYMGNIFSGSAGSP